MEATNPYVIKTQLKAPKAGWRQQYNDPSLDKFILCMSSYQSQTSTVLHSTSELMETNNPVMAVWENSEFITVIPWEQKLEIFQNILANISNHLIS